jgi:hypothetical protein
MELFLDEGPDFTAADCGQEAVDAAGVIGHEGALRLLDKGMCTETYLGDKRIMSLRTHMENFWESLEIVPSTSIPACLNFPQRLPSIHLINNIITFQIVSSDVDRKT